MNLATCKGTADERALSTILTLCLAWQNLLAATMQQLKKQAQFKESDSTHLHNSAAGERLLRRYDSLVRIAATMYILF